MFGSARFKLTLWFLLIASLISFSFSAAIYRTTCLEIDRFVENQRFRYERRYPFNPPPITIIDPDLITETKRRLFLNLLVINAGIITVSGLVGFSLSSRTLQPIADMVEEQNRFISDASHELRTPLTSLKSAFEVYLRGKKPNLKEAKAIIEESIGEVDKLQSLSEGLLQLARYQSPKSLTLEPVSLKTAASKALARVKPLAAKKKIILQSAISPVTIEGVEDKIVDLIVILLDNAIKYSPDKSTVYLKIYRQGRKNIIRVKDRGIGISAADLPHIFNRFYRSDSARTKTDAGGYGLGLSIAQRIVDLHGASIKVESKPGKGSTFSVIFQS